MEVKAMGVPEGTVVEPKQRHCKGHEAKCWRF